MKKRREADIIKHINEQHDSKGLVKKIALKPREPGNYEYKCEVCEDTFSKPSLLNKHRFRVHNLGLSTEYSCIFCSIKCASKPGLRAHERTHMTKQFSCVLCSKSFVHENLLRDHVEKGVCKLQNRTCDVCSKTFCDKVRKDQHMKIHNKVRAFSCQKCGKSFVQKRSLKEHLLTHEKTRRYACKLCEKRFVQPNHLKYHVTSQHPSAFPEFAKHVCNFCSKAFAFLHQLKRHTKIHCVNNTKGSSGESSLQCEICSNWFSTPVLLRNHLEQCFDIDEEVQDEMGLIPDNEMIDDEQESVTEDGLKSMVEEEQEEIICRL